MAHSYASIRQRVNLAFCTRVATSARISYGGTGPRILPGALRTMNYRCPVCFYPSLPLPPEDHNICLCCGTEFGFDDFDSTFDELRERWVRNQMPWFSR